MHGSHYLLSLVVFTLHVVIGLIFASEVAPISACSAVLASLLLALAVARTQPREVGAHSWKQRLAIAGRRGLRLLVLFTWIAPAVFIAMNIAQALLTHDPSRTLLPGPALFQAIGLIGLCAPIIVLLVGLAGLKQLGVGSFLAVVVTYVLAFYLDICGVLLGLVDRISGGGTWQVVHRAETSAKTSATSETPGLQALIVPVHLKESWRMRRILASTQNAVTRKQDDMKQRAR
ncbi:MAG: hypothetical protein JKY56_02750 [Kofleriaceae bacterium]|nr:hypothetical protein [Kofleriaceae bacterium]